MNSQCVNLRSARTQQKTTPISRCLHVSVDTPTSKKSGTQADKQVHHHFVCSTRPHGRRARLATRELPTITMRSKEDSDEDERAREDALGAARCRAAATVAPRLPAANAEETVDVETLGRRVALSARAPECGVLPSAFQPATSSVRDANFLFNSATRPRRAWSSSTRARRVPPTPSLRVSPPARSAHPPTPCPAGSRPLRVMSQLLLLLLREAAPIWSRRRVPASAPSPRRATDDASNAEPLAERITPVTLPFVCTEPNA